MSLVRHWIPSPNYSGGSTKRLLVLHTTEGFTGSNGMYDCGYYFQSSSAGASSQVVIDNFHPGHIVECVSSSKGAWTQCNYNSVSVSAEQCGYASWSRSTWLNDKEPLLRNTAAWLAEESKRFGIPLTDLTSSQAQGGGRGVCYHSELGSTGCGHSDPGSGYPLDVVLDWARGGGTTTPPVEPEPVVEEEEDMPIIPRRAEGSPEVPVEVCMNGPYKDVGFISDTSVLPGPIQIRVALHIIGSPGWWQVHNVTLDKSHDRVVVRGNDASHRYDGVSFRRQDFVQSDVWPVFVK